ncbi:MAG TPA: TonB-dependent receptor [Steroidobacteraceae bacterium]|nr:TonB-dependent receptor [Steroidobacteraceae bacterium]
MNLRSAVRAACIVAGAAALTPGLVYAQSSPRNTRSGEELEEVIVTGSKLLRPDAVAPIPVTSVNAGEIEASGVTMISDYIRELPVFGINSGRTTETSGADSAKPLSTAGTERLNLRDLGTDRTLVVVDGRRHVGSTAGSTAVDVASIPTALIERVEISTGGASTAYGADAIAGVVNFITKKNFEGVQVDSRYGDSDQGGGENTYIALTVGGNFAEDRGNAVFSASYNDIGGILGSQRKYITDRWGFVANPADTGPNDGIPAQILRRDTRFTNLLNHQGSAFGLLDGSQLIFNNDGTTRPFNYGDPATTVVGAVVGGDGLDPTTNANVATPMQRKSIFASLNYKLTDKVNFFAEGKSYLSGAQVISPALLDAITYPENGELFFISQDNPFLPANDPVLAQQFANNFGLVLMSRWHDDFPLRSADIQRTLNRFVAGVEGETGFKDWHFEIYGQYGHTDEEYREFNNRDPRRFRLATDAVTDVTGITGVAPGSPVCRATLTAFQAGGTTDPDLLACRPVNLFGRGNESQESLDYFLIDLLTNKSLEQTVASASLNGSLFDLPAGPVSFAFGLEYRKESSEAIPDANQQQGKTFTGTTPAVKGEYDVSEAYIETRFPLLKDKPFAELLAVEGGFRTSDNSVTGGSNSWRAGGEWAPVRDIRFRGMYAKSVRAPNVGELFTPQAPAISVPEDPCLAENVAGGPDPARRLANCQQILAPYGLDPLTYVLNPNFVGFAFGGVGGGNPNLKEETATSVTYGVVFNPRFLPGLTLSVDFYDIDIDDVIISPTPPSIADGCVDNFTSPDNELCGLVTRDNDPTSLGFGAIKSVNITTRNLASLSTSGIDFQADYSWRLGPGALNTRLIANYIDSYRQKQLESAVHEDELVGGPRLPEIRGGLQIGYNTESWSLNYQIRYIDGVRFSAVEALNPVETTDPYTVGSETISDISGMYRFDTAGFSWQLSVGVDNIFEEEPPPGTRTGRFTGGSPYYDPIGRFYYGGLKVSF